MLFEKMTLKEQILRLHNTGMKQVEIARELKTYTNYVWKVINEHKGDK
jgi:transcriptional regulator